MLRKGCPFFKVWHNNVTEFAFRLLHAHALGRKSVSYKSRRILLPKFKKLHFIKLSKAFLSLLLSLRLVDEISWVNDSAVWAEFTPSYPPEFFEFRKSQNIFIWDPVDCSSNIQVFKITGTIWLVTRPTPYIIQTEISGEENYGKNKLFFLTEKPMYLIRLPSTVW